jgi:hypothetical protein
MIRHLFFQNYDLIYKTVATLLTVGAAGFLAYLILLIRW